MSTAKANGLMMPLKLDRNYVIDLSAGGDWVEVDVSDVSQISVRAVDHELWGSATVTVSKVLGGDSVPFSPALLVSNSLPTEEAIPVEDVDTIRLEPGVLGTNFGRVNVTGKNTLV